LPPAKCGGAHVVVAVVVVVVVAAAGHLRCEWEARGAAAASGVHLPAGCGCPVYNVQHEMHETRAYPTRNARGTCICNTKCTGLTCICNTKCTRLTWSDLN